MVTYFRHLRTRRVTWTPPPSSSSVGKRRKRKKRRKRRTPRTSSHSRGPVHCRQRQWYVHCSFCCFGASHAVFPPFVGRSHLLGIMDVMDQKERYVAPCRKLRIFRSCSSSRSLISCRDAEAHPHGPCDHRDSPVAH